MSCCFPADENLGPEGLEDRGSRGEGRTVERTGVGPYNIWVLHDKRPRWTGILGLRSVFVIISVKIVGQDFVNDI